MVSVSTHTALLHRVGASPGHSTTVLVAVIVVLVTGVGAVTVHAVTPQHEHALLYSVPLQALA